MTDHEKVLFLRDEFKTNYQFALKILKDNNFNLEDAYNFFKDMNND